MEVVISIISFILGCFAQKIFDTLFDKVSKAKLYRKQRKTILKLTESIKSSSDTDIQIIASGMPYFSRNDIFIKSSESELYLSFPRELVEKLSSSSGSFKNKDVLFKEISIPGYTNEEVRNAIESARVNVANGFINRTDGLYFNGMKYGVLYSDGFSRTSDDIERPLLTCQFFKTDHFTHIVLLETLKLLKVPSTLFSLPNLNEQLNWARTSIGVSVIIVLKHTNQILMTRRSRMSSFSEGKSWIYVAVTETFTETDYDRYNMVPDIVQCIKRGILEEIGLDSDLYEDSKIKFYDMFFETHFYQDGLVASVEIDEKISFNDIRTLNAKDKQLEVESMFLIDNNKKAINNYIAQNHKEMRSQTIFALKSYEARL